jgi:hypothetical protein
VRGVADGDAQRRLLAFNREPSRVLH